MHINSDTNLPHQFCAIKERTITCRNYLFQRNEKKDFTRNTDVTPELSKSQARENAFFLDSRKIGSRELFRRLLFALPSATSCNFQN